MSLAERCSVCGLPKELCVCAEIAKEQQKITITIGRVRYGKKVTLVEGINPGDANIRDLMSHLKNKLGCGGTYKKSMVLLQGDHTRKLKNILVEWGIPEERIEVT